MPEHVLLRIVDRDLQIRPRLHGVTGQGVSFHMTEPAESRPFLPFLKHTVHYHVIDLFSALLLFLILVKALWRRDKFQLPVRRISVQESDPGRKQPALYLLEVLFHRQRVDDDPPKCRARYVPQCDGLSALAGAVVGDPYRLQILKNNF